MDAVSLILGIVVTIDEFGHFDFYKSKQIGKKIVTLFLATQYIILILSMLALLIYSCKKIVQLIKIV